jgi:hypothetical protein
MATEPTVILRYTSSTCFFDPYNKFITRDKEEYIKLGVLLM